MSAWRCPNCASRDLKVSVEMWARLIQEDDGENFETEIEDGDHEWDSESAMVCLDCGHGGKVCEFTTDDDDDDPEEVIPDASQTR